MNETAVCITIIRTTLYPEILYRDNIVLKVSGNFNPHTIRSHSLSWSRCHTGRQLASVAGRRRSTSSVWRIALPCWRTRTKPSSRNSKPSKTCTATNQSKKKREKRSPNARREGWGSTGDAPCPSPCTETQHRAMHPDATPLPPFSTILLSFLKLMRKPARKFKKNKKKNNTHHVSLTKELNSWFHSHQLDRD